VFNCIANNVDALGGAAKLEVDSIILTLRGEAGWGEVNAPLAVNSLVMAFWAKLFQNIVH
jgi:hypothetical protein